MNPAPETARILRVFVSSPGDVAAERAVLDEVVESINRTDGRACGVRLELWKWEQDAVPQIGPRPQDVIDTQTPAYDIYLGILAHRFGTKTGRFGSGTEQEFRDALKRWSATGSPWILFYFAKRRSIRTNWIWSNMPRSASFANKSSGAGKDCTPRTRRCGAAGRVFSKRLASSSAPSSVGSLLPHHRLRRHRRRAATPRPISATCWRRLPTSISGA